MANGGPATQHARAVDPKGLQCQAHPQRAKLEPQLEARSKVPQFGVKEEKEKEDGAYTAYFENCQKNKNVEPVLDAVEPQLNQDVNSRAQPPTTMIRAKNKVDDHHSSNASRGSNTSMAKTESVMRYGKQSHGGQSPVAQSIKKGPDRGAAIPAWGAWNSDPSQAEGFAGTFGRAKEEREPVLNRARIPLLNEGWVKERAWSLGRVDNEHVYGGGRRLTVEQKGGNNRDVGNASKGSLASAAAPLRKETKLLQVSSNATPASGQLPTLQSSLKLTEKGRCFPWLVPGQKTKTRKRN